MATPHARRAVTAVAAIVVALAAVPAAAANIPPPPGEPWPATNELMGQGLWQGRPAGGRLIGAFECVVTAPPTAVGTGIPRCELHVDGAVVAQGTPMGFLGPVAVSGSPVAIALLTPPRSIDVCWDAWAVLANGELRTNSGCTSHPVQ